MSSGSLIKTEPSSSGPKNDIIIIVIAVITIIIKVVLCCNQNEKVEINTFKFLKVNTLARYEHETTEYLT